MPHLHALLSWSKLDVGSPHLPAAPFDQHKDDDGDEDDEDDGDEEEEQDDEDDFMLLPLKIVNHDDNQVD